MAEQEGPKLHIDSDWKAQAQAEKERLVQQESQQEQKKSQQGEGKLPPADFRGLVGLLASQAMMGLGMFGDQGSGRVMVDLDGAKFNIDLLGVIEEKTKGNLSEDESTELSQILNELRHRFVQVNQLVAQQMAAQGQPGQPGQPQPSAGEQPAGRIEPGQQSPNAGDETGGPQGPIVS